MLRDQGDAREQVQNAWCNAFEHLGQYRGDAEFRVWLLRIVSNQCLLLIRYRRRARFLYLDADPTREQAVPPELPARETDPEHAVMNHELRDVLRREIHHIPPLLRNVLLLREVQELPISEVAVQLNITVPAAKSRLSRARRELRERMVRCCGPSSNRWPPRGTPVQSACRED
jgi:RNA polymerase sigma-70 factor (ECF subfamily)